MSAGRSRTLPPSAKLFRLGHVRKQKDCEQVAAVCYRMRGEAVEFLLVRTGSGHWTFPKGGVEPGLSHAQAAALEAFEEAGVHGRMEEASFTRYLRRKRQSPGRPAGQEVATSAHLCEVSRLTRPQEANRKPTWFAAEKAKAKLMEGRTAQFADELARVVESAVGRIQRQRRALAETPAAPPDALRKVRFEAGAEVEGSGRSWKPQSNRRWGSVMPPERAARRKALPPGPVLVATAAKPGKKLTPKF